MHLLPYIIGGLILFIVLFQAYMWISIKKLKGRKVPMLSARDDDDTKLYYFYSDECTYCRNMTPIIDNMCERHCNVVKVDTAEQWDIARQCGVRGVPAVLVVKHGVVEEALIGVQPRKRLESLLTAS